MKIITTGIFYLIVLAGICQTTEKFTIPLSEPGKKGKLEVGQVNGDIIVEGYSGQEVLIEASIADANSSHSRERNNREEAKTPPPGMKRINSNPVEISVKEYRNKVEIDTESWKRRTDLYIKVPTKFDLEISTVHGIIKVSGLDGAMEVSNVNGPITMEEVKGSVLTNTVNGNIVVRLKSATANAQMSFVTLNGDIDVTLPPGIKATVKMKSDRGEIYSDFDMKTEMAREEVKKGADCDCEYEVSINSFTKGTINGGGPEFTFKNMSGDIIIRKGN